MRKVLKIARDVVFGAVGFGGSVAVGLDVNTAILIGASALLLAVGVDFEIVKKLKELFDNEK
jgi:hypothetical protein